MDNARDIDVLMAIYSIETSLKDIFVEGRSDKLFLEWYLMANNINDVNVYAIDNINIPDHLLIKHGLSLGSKRSRVLALACELDSLFKEDLKVLCLADRDFEDYMPTISEKRHLQLTDGNSIELYAFNFKTLRKFINIALGGLPISIINFIQIVSSILERVYAIRLNNELLGWGMEWIPFNKYVDVKKGIISFNENGFVRAYLQKNNRWTDRLIFEQKINETVSQLSHEPARKIRGHDLSELLMVIIRNLRNDRKYGNSETLEGSLMASLECSDLVKEPFFQRILATAAA